MFEPGSDWTPPESYPDLSGAKVLAIDLETRDPHLKQRGPGAPYGDGEICGICVASDTGYSGYFPIAHLSGGNMDRDITMRWLANTVGNEKQIKVGANFIYDLQWLACSGVEVKGPVHDIQIMEGLLDEEGRYSLDALSQKYLGKHKEETLLVKAAIAMGLDPKSDLWRMHSKYVGPYGEGDALNTLRVYEKQKPLIAAEGLQKVFELESALIPIFTKMRVQGVRVDLEKAEVLDKRLSNDYETMLYGLKRRYGFDINPWTSSHLEAICQKEQIPVVRTAKGNPSFVKEWLEEQQNPGLKEVVRARTLDRLRGTFIREKIINASHNGRIHSQFHQMRGDEGGTRTGRVSSSNPNLQQVPSRDELAPLIRGLFIPEDGESWAKLDYSQQEPRIAVHYAVVCGLDGAKEARDAYKNGSDFYTFIVDKAQISRRDSKTLTLGRMYGMGVSLMAERLHCSISEAYEILQEFDAGAPFLSRLADLTAARAQSKGFIETIGGRHRHFESYVPVGDRESTGLRHNKAEVRWSGKRLERHGCHKALNSLIQGSAADQTKQAMLDIYNDTKKVPLLQVHDEIDYSMGELAEAQNAKMLCERAVKMEVPTVCDLDWGRSWK
jgi:DNA polymerase I-like protein with 3'-5' exonuclease and polymerase domains